MTAQTGPDDAGEKTAISLYEFYAIGIERLIEKSPWELERAVSAYHDSFLTEQRCLALSILLLIGEEHVPEKYLREALPGSEEQTRTSVNQATFMRALRRYFEQHNLNPVRADMALKLMQSYLTDSREADKAHESPLQAMYNTIAKRVPPKDEAQKQQYAARVEKIYDYVDGLVQGSLLKRYEITS
ncbi:MAG: hypothetical protein WDN27_02825 [Candidatus Saccharibacteria bacterium]